MMTYNIGHFNYGVGVGLPSSIYAEKLNNYKNFLESCGCSIIGIQEYATYIDEAQTISSDTALFDLNYPKNGGQTNLWCALKSKYRFYNKESGSFGNRPYVAATMNVNGNPVYFLCVHLSPGAANASARVTEAQQIIQKVSNKTRYVIFGDFNPEPGEEDSLFSLFASENMNLANCGNFGKIVTYHNDPRYIIDNIITSSNITIENAYSLDVYSLLSSDHLPLIAQLRF